MNDLFTIGFLKRFSFKEWRIVVLWLWWFRWFWWPLVFNIDNVLFRSTLATNVAYLNFKGKGLVPIENFHQFFHIYGQLSGFWVVIDVLIILRILNDGDFTKITCWITGTEMVLQSDITPLKTWIILSQCELLRLGAFSAKCFISAHFNPYRYISRV